MAPLSERDVAVAMLVGLTLSIYLSIYPLKKRISEYQRQRREVPTERSAQLQSSKQAKSRLELSGFKWNR